MFVVYRKYGWLVGLAALMLLAAACSPQPVAVPLASGRAPLTQGDAALFRTSSGIPVRIPSGGNALNVPAVTDAVGWYGELLGPEDKAEDQVEPDVLRLSTDDEVRLTAATDAIAQQIAVYRNRAAGVLVWGTVTCTAGDCGLRANRVQPASAGITVDAVEGWTGTIVTVTDSAGDDALLLDGPLVVRYGLEPAFLNGGEVDLAARIIALRDSETPVRLWGSLVCGVRDVNGCRVVVRQMLAQPRPQAAEPTLITQEHVEGWAGAVVPGDGRSPYPVGFRFEGGDHVVGIGTEDAELYAQFSELIVQASAGNPVPVRVWGTIYYHDPDSVRDDLIYITALEQD